jgi:formate dehydrogenase iron-sulfur subunit
MLTSAANRCETSTSPGYVLPAFVDDLLREQHELTAVEKFARDHASKTLPAQSKYYRDLLPTTLPEAGEQYAFEVNLDLCSGCKACVTACHELNGLDEAETWRGVGLLQGIDPLRSSPVVQHVTTACHHCVEPGCLSGCPTLAYEKDPVTGIVKHLDDQCFGCQYCILACPYDVPKYHAAKGIVRKCDLCSGRLATGEAPACVQACPHQAIRITKVNLAAVQAATQSGSLVPDAPESRWTQPTTRYHSSRLSFDSWGTDNSQGRPVVALVSADAGHVTAEHAHWPLIVMLVLSQLSVGLLCTSLLPVTSMSAGLAAIAVAWVTALVSIAAATLHLGRPLLAYRAVLGWKTSWLSREIIAFGAYFKGLTVLSVWQWLFPQLWPQLSTSFGGITSGLGLVGVYCSYKIYAVTPRPYWNAADTAARFSITLTLLGLAANWIVGVSAGHATSEAVQATAGCLILISGWRLLADVRRKVQIDLNGVSWQAQSARVIERHAATISFVRWTTLLVGGVLFPVVSLVAPAPTIGMEAILLAGISLLLLVVSEFCERTIFFVAAVAPRMPGGITT